MNPIKLCVNIDHIATLRQARGGTEPDVIRGAEICEQAGAHGITVHLREDRRHIQDADVFRLKDTVKGVFNLEMALSDDIISVARKVKPDQITLVPEKRQELTTEGGLDVKNRFDRIKDVCAEFRESGTVVSLFVEPDIQTVEMSLEAGADYVELHTGTYSNAMSRDEVVHETGRLMRAADYASEIGIGLNAGHGLNYDNLGPLLKAKGLNDLNIGHSIISRAVFTGLREAVESMLAIIRSCEQNQRET